MVQIKVCGITREVDAELLIGLGVEAMGLNFYAESPRRISPEQAQTLSQYVGGRLLCVGVFVNESRVRVRELIDDVGLDVLQFHGDEYDAHCASFGLPYLKAVRVDGPVDGAALQMQYPNACAILLDTYVAGRPGGTGKAFDWSYWPQACEGKFILAGGLAPDNVRSAIDLVAPWGVDVSGGVEGSTRGQKDPERVARFVKEVRDVESR